MTRVLCVVGVLALVFTTVNVTRFATSRDVPLPIAVLLDPMIGTALAGVLYVDARLASWGITPPAWSTALRWGAGSVAALMNTWESLWPDGQIGWPHRADPAAVLLHLTPALLLIALAETIAAYRRTITDLLDRIASTEHSVRPRPLAAASGSAPGHTHLDTTATEPPPSPPTAGRSDPDSASPHAPSTTGPGRDRPSTADDTPDGPATAHAPQADGDTATGADVWARAVALDAAARAATGKPVSIWRLRTDLRIGPRRAQQIRQQLLAHRPGPPPPA
ncbi:extensin [Streptomyces sp. NPDC059002]|uniref:extensin n=1 Tax=Streptomyces sp. NPDC059002 TaxID=3346690 RepID=UPI0036746DBC